MTISQRGSPGRFRNLRPAAGVQHAKQVAVGPHDGVFITGGSHFLAYDAANGEGETADGRLVGNALVFQREGLTIRIEGNLPRDRTVAIGASLR